MSNKRPGRDRAPKTALAMERDVALIWERRPAAELHRRAIREAGQLAETLTELARAAGADGTAHSSRPDDLALAIINRAIDASGPMQTSGPMQASGYAALAGIAEAIVAAVGHATNKLHERHQHGGLPLPGEESEADVRARLARLAGATPTEVGRAAAPQSEDRAEAARKRDGRRRVALEPYRRDARRGIHGARRVMLAFDANNRVQLGRRLNRDLSSVSADGLERLCAGIDWLSDEQRESIVYSARAATRLVTDDEVERVAMMRFLGGRPTDRSSREAQEESRPAKPRDAAIAWLERELAGGPRDAGELLAAGIDAGHSKRTLSRARTAIGVVVDRIGRGMDHRSVWRLATPATSRRQRTHDRGRNRP